MTEWMLAHPWMTFIGWCWGIMWVSMGWPPLVSVRPYTPKERKTLEQKAK